jgi:Glycosyl hydrolase family 3 C-terminal domain
MKRYAQLFAPHYRGFHEGTFSGRIPPLYTHEAEDLETVSLPNGQDEVVRSVAAANPHTIVVIESGDPVLMPWAANVNGIVEAWYPGVRGGEALASLLFGKANFSGKLAITFPASDSDPPHAFIAAPPGKKPGPIDGIMNFQTPFPAPHDEGLKVGYSGTTPSRKSRHIRLDLAYPILHSRTRI